VLQRAPQPDELALVLDLQPDQVLHVEDVDRAHAVDGDVRRGDLQHLVADRRRHIVQPARPVAAIHLDSGEAVGRMVVDHHARRHSHGAQRGEEVQIFIGAESGLFDSAGLSMVVAPFRNGQERIVGAIGVIGPTRINYGRVIPVVDYTARVIGRLLG
jgi:hypothetical protein